jgi:hypothetical protein
MIKNSFISALPIIVIAQAFHLTTNGSISESLLEYLKPVLYGSFFISAIVVPVYFWVVSFQQKTTKMFLLINITWGVFSAIETIMAFTVYPGLAKDIVPSIENVAIFFIKWFIIGVVPLSLISVTVVAIFGKALLRNCGRSRT